MRKVVVAEHATDNVRAAWVVLISAAAQNGSGVIDAEAMRHAQSLKRDSASDRAGLVDSLGRRTGWSDRSSSARRARHSYARNQPNSPSR